MLNFYQIPPTGLHTPDQEVLVKQGPSFLINLFIYFGCGGSSLLNAGFL